MLYYLLELALIGLRPSSPPALEQGRARGIPLTQGFEMFQSDKGIKIQNFPMQCAQATKDKDTRS